MKKTRSLYAFSLSQNLAFTALFAALCCVGTLAITVPLPFGYFNAGDIFVLAAGWCLGPLYGSVAAGIGSALADVIAGFPVYAPATFLIKAVDALTAYLVWAILKKVMNKENLDFLIRIPSAIAGECVMVGGYFLYEWLLYGFAAATGTLFGNTLQGVFCGVSAILLISALYRVKADRNLFERLS